MVRRVVVMDSNWGVWHKGERHEREETDVSWFLHLLLEKVV